MARLTGVWVAGMVGLFVACGGAQEVRAPAGEAPAAAVAAPEVVSLPETPVGGATGWFLDQLDGDPDGEPPPAEVLRERFTPEFLDVVPVENLASTFVQFSTSFGPLVPLAIERDDPLGLSLVVRSRDGLVMRLVAQVEAAPPHRFEGLLLQAAPDADPDRPRSLEEAARKARLLAPEHGFAVYRISGDACVPVVESGGETSLAIGSTFKLWVLEALAFRIAAGDLSWEEPLPIRAAWKSLPTGDFHNLSEGSAVSILDHASAMISTSDNTATDHLLHFMGRRSVEASLERTGHGRPERNRPFLSTREFFALKLATPEDEVDGWIASDAGERARWLVEVAPGKDVSLELATDWTRPMWIDSIEWFASSRDLCGVSRALLAHRGTASGGPLGGILSRNPGVEVDRSRWRWVGFKGGSEPGVLQFTWILERIDGAMFVVTGTWNDPSQEVNAGGVVSLMQTTIRLLGDEVAPEAPGSEGSGG